MSGVIKFVKLDLITIKPYLTLKNIITYIVIALIVAISSENYASIISMLIIFVFLYGSYPFAVGDQEGLNSLYSILSLNRKDIVKGRYLFLIVLNIVGFALSLLIYVLVSLLFSKEVHIEEMFFVSYITSFLGNMNYLIQYPFFFKNGYLKSASFIFLPMMIIVAIGVVVYNFFKVKTITLFTIFIKYIFNNVLSSIIISLGVWILLIYISYRVSLKIYYSKDL